ncbi:MULTISPECIES: S66 peptidase family protein [Bacillaceae]|uniref:S66 family peptidase n=2 Tax=Bacillales TaxID=1385 RepID=UPI001CEF89DA|nr:MULTISPECIES: S66 peptidase family protein [Bacillaceae]
MLEKVVDEMDLKKSDRLSSGDRIATASFSWGGAGDPDIRWRYQIGKKRLEEFGLEVIELPHTLKGSEYVYNHPEERARDLMDAFQNPSIKGIFSCIGGDDSIRMLPYIDYEVIKNNPKIFLGYSDSTVTHFICYKAGVMSYYGPSILAEFAENVEAFDYTNHWVKRVLFSGEPIGEVGPPSEWTSEFIPWEKQNWTRKRKTSPHSGYELLQGEGIHKGKLLGGCMDVLEMLKGTVVWPAIDEWKDKLIFFETSEVKVSPDLFLGWLRNYAAQGILQNAKGLLFSKPYDDCYYDEYKEAILSVVRDELKLTDLPILYNMSFGHTAPMSIIPLGAMAELDCERKTFSILEAGVN